MFFVNEAHLFETFSRITSNCLTEEAVSEYRSLLNLLQGEAKKEPGKQSSSKLSRNITIKFASAQKIKKSCVPPLASLMTIVANVHCNH